jgi:hypothetical protein
VDANSVPKRLVKTYRKETYEQRDIEARSCNHYFPVKSINDTYSECAFVALDVYRAMRLRRIVICGPSGSTICSTLTHKTYDFRKRMLKIKCLF